MNKKELFNPSDGSRIEVTYVYGEGYGKTLRSEFVYAVPDDVHVDDVKIALDDVLADEGHWHLDCLSKTNYYAAETEAGRGEIVHDETVSVRVNHTPYEAVATDA